MLSTVRDGTTSVLRYKLKKGGNIMYRTLDVALKNRKLYCLLIEFALSVRSTISSRDAIEFGYVRAPLIC